MNKVILSGASGAMGRVVSDFFPKGEIIAGVDIQQNPDVSYPTYKDVSQIPEDIIKAADCVLDFSTAAFFPTIANFAADNNLALVVATTGLDNKSKELAEKLAKRIPIVLSSNFSIGINTILKTLEPVVKTLGEDYDIEIIEKHHNKKIDAPSGTAITIANTISEAMPENPEIVYNRNEHGKREKNEIGISAVRGGTIPGEHTVLFAGEDELIEIKHTALSKKIFAAGAQRAIDWIVNQPAGLYDMQTVLFNE